MREMWVNPFVTTTHHFLETDNLSELVCELHSQAHKIWKYMIIYYIWLGFPFIQNTFDKWEYWPKYITLGRRVADPKRLPNARFMLGFVLRWLNINLTSVQRLMAAQNGFRAWVGARWVVCFWCSLSKHEALTQCWYNVGPLFTTLAQH